MAPQRLLSFSKMNAPSSVTALGKIIFLTDPDLLTNALVFFFFWFVSDCIYTISLRV